MNPRSPPDSASGAFEYFFAYEFFCKKFVISFYLYAMGPKHVIGYKKPGRRQADLIKNGKSNKTALVNK